MARLIEILHNEHADRMVFVNSGDDFTGGFESSKEVSKGGIIKDFFNTMKLQATVLGNHEFDYGQ
jgi:2',3'-cyclic-nucleotide 2'-phosphodiesterase (5'-nucleotidase family)